MRIIVAFAVLLSLLIFKTLTASATNGDHQVIVTQDDGTTAPSALHVTDSGDVFAGMTDPQNWHINEFRWMADRGVFTTPRLLVADDADPGDLAFRRNGDVTSDGTRFPVSEGQNLGAIYWQPKVEGADHGGFAECVPNRWPFSTFGCRRSSQITGIAGGTPTSTSTPGYLGFYTTKVNEISPSLNMKLSDPGDNQTAMWLMVQKNGVETFHRVEIGPADSAGIGYRVLRVALPDDAPPAGTASVKGIVFQDNNKNGAIDSGEQRLVGRPVELRNLAGDQTLQTTTTDASGQYLFSSLAKQDYRVQHTVPAGFTKTTDNSRPIDGQKDFNNNSTFTWNFGIAPN